MPPPGEEPSPRIRDRLAGEVVAAGCRGPIEEKLPGMLRSGEQVDFVTMCTPGGSWLSELRDMRILVLTDLRLLLVPLKLLLSENLAQEAAALPTREIAHRDVREVTERLGVLESKLKLDVAGQEVWLTSMRKKSARTAAEVIRRRAGEASAWWR